MWVTPHASTSFVTWGNPMHPPRCLLKEMACECSQASEPTELAALAETQATGKLLDGRGFANSPFREGTGI